MKAEIFRQCQSLFPEWQARSMADFEFDDPKGFSSFTMGIRSKRPLQPEAVLYRRLEGKDNAILDFATEKSVFMTLGAQNIAAHCYHYDESCRIEAFYRGRSLQAADLFEPENLRQIANQLYRLHALRPPGLPRQGLFDLIHEKWGRLAKRVLEREAGAFPPEEQAMCEALRPIYSDETRDRVRRCLPGGDLVFCHNDTYHGNIMKLDDGRIKLVDFEFSCLNHRAYDFASPFAETVMRHGLTEYPHFRIAEPEFGDHELGTLINYYLDNDALADPEQKAEQCENFLRDARRMLILSDYKYAMAALPLAVNPIQKIRFIPYAYQRFNKFLAASEQCLQA